MTIEEPYRKLMPKQSNEILTNFIYPAFLESKSKAVKKKLSLNSKLNASYSFSRILNGLYNVVIHYLKSRSQTYSFNAEHMSGSLAYCTLENSRKKNQDPQEISIFQNLGKCHGSLNKVRLLDG